MATSTDDADVQRLIARSRDLKRELIDFAEYKRFDRWLEPIAAKAARAADPKQREAEWIRGLDDFVMTFRFPDGGGIIDRFLAARKDLADDDRKLLETWRDRPVDSIFEVRAKNVLNLTLLNLLDDKEYEAYAAIGAENLWRINVGEFVVVRLVPLTEADPDTEAAPDSGTWVISGPMGSTPASAKRRIIKMAFDLASHAPVMAFTSEDIRERSRAAMRRDRERFIGFFGADEVVLKTHEVAERMNDFRAQAKKAVLAGGEDMPALYMAPFELPGNFTWTQTIGVIYDESDGIGFVADYAKIRDLFANPDLATSKEHAKLLHGYLKADGVSPTPLRRLAAAHPDTADVVFRKVLKKPDFTWARDGEALLRKHKPQDFKEKPQPTLAVVGARLRELAGVLSSIGSHRWPVHVFENRQDDRCLIAPESLFSSLTIPGFPASPPPRLPRWKAGRSAVITRTSNLTPYVPRVTIRPQEVVMSGNMTIDVGRPLA